MLKAEYNKVSKLAAGIFLLIAIAPFPYGYYTFLRILVTIISLLIILNKETHKAELIIFLLIAILFNPIIPIYLTKSIWIPIDIIVAIFFLWSARGLKLSSK